MEVYASVGPKVIVVVNTSTTPRDAVIAVSSGTAATGYQKDGSTVSYTKPTDLGSLPVSGGRIRVHLPGPSVTQLVVS